MLDLNPTGAFVDGGREPVDAPIGENNYIGEDGHLVRTISTVREQEGCLSRMLKWSTTILKRFFSY